MRPLGRVAAHVRSALNAYTGGVAALHKRVPSSVAGVSRWSRWGRRAGAAVVTGVVAAALVGPAPVRAQLPELFPSSTATTQPPSSTSTLLPPLEHLATTTTAAPGGPTTTGLLSLPTAAPGAPPPTLLPEPPGPKTSRTTTFNTLPVPPRTPLRMTTTTLQGSIRPSTVPVAEDQEGGDEEAGFDDTLPFTPEDELIQAAGLDRELGGGDVEGQDPITLMASIAAGLIALVLLGVVGWIQAQVRGRPHLW